MRGLMAILTCSGNLQMHLPVPKRALCEHVLGDSANARRSSHGNPSVVLFFHLFQKAVAVDEDPYMAVKL